MVGEVPVGGVRNHAHHSGRFTEHHGLRATGPGQLKSGSDQAAAYRASQRAAPSRLPRLTCWPGRRHADILIQKWTPSTSSAMVDAVH
jgi:hypothetical protein